MPVTLSGTFQMPLSMTGQGMEWKEKKTTIEIEPLNSGHKMERANSMDVRKDLFGQIDIIVYRSFKETAGAAVWNTERDDPE